MIQTGGEIYFVPGLEESILLKLPYYPRQSIESMKSLSNYQWHFSQNQNKKKNKFVWKHKRSLVAKTNLRKNTARGIMLPDYRLYYKANIMKIVWY